MNGCDSCIAFNELNACTQKPKREDYTDENSYLIDLESGVWNCQNAFKELQKRIMQSESIIKRLLINRPDTYSGTDVESNQRKMFAFNSAVNDAIEYMKENE